jgi:dipeptidase
MDIIKVTPQIWRQIDELEPGLIYCGRSHNSLGLGTPYDTKKAPYVRYVCSTKQQAVAEYGEWLKEIVTHYLEGTRHLLVTSQEKYLQRMFKLCSKIKDGTAKTLVCHDFEYKDYTPCLDGEEKSHVEHLYKQCLRIVENEKHISAIVACTQKLHLET